MRPRAASAIEASDELAVAASTWFELAWLATHGRITLDLPVRSGMTAKVKICNGHHTVNEVMEIMTRERFRHLPVEQDGRLDGIISIGDVVKRRIEDVEREAEEIRAYIATA